MEKYRLIRYSTVGRPAQSIVDTAHGITSYTGLSRGCQLGLGFKYGNDGLQDLGPMVRKNSFHSVRSATPFARLLTCPSFGRAVAPLAGWPASLGHGEGGGTRYTTFPVYHIPSLSTPPPPAFVKWKRSYKKNSRAVDPASAIPSHVELAHMKVDAVSPVPLARLPRYHRPPAVAPSSPSVACAAPPIASTAAAATALRPHNQISKYTQNKN